MPSKLLESISFVHGKCKIDDLLKTMVDIFMGTTC